MGGDQDLSASTSDKTRVHCGSWNFNFNSQKSFKYQQRYLLIKYEDLVNDKEKIFLSILKFIYKLKNTDFLVDKKKLKNALDSTSFEKMQIAEKETGFFESKLDKKTGKKINFFNLGKKNDWKKLLDTKVSNEIENSFKEEMKELRYL